MKLQTVSIGPMKGPMHTTKFALSTGGLFLSAAGDVVSVLRVSREQNLYLGNDRKVYSGTGQFVRHRHRARVDSRDLVRDAAMLGPDDAPTDIHWAICRAAFLSSPAYHGLVEIGETTGLDQSRLHYFIDRWLGENQMFSRFRHCLAIMARHFLEVTDA